MPDSAGGWVCSCSKSIIQRSSRGFSPPVVLNLGTSICENPCNDLFASVNQLKPLPYMADTMASAGAVLDMPTRWHWV